MNCKIGDLAIVISASHEFEKNLGAIVAIIAPGLEPTEWEVEAKGRPILGRDMDTGLLLSSGPNIRCFISDRVLRPVSGLRQPEENLAEHFGYKLPMRIALK